MVNLSNHFFIIESPFQCKILKKYIHSRKLSNYHLLVRLNGIKSNDNAILKELSCLPTINQHVITVPREKKISLFILYITTLKLIFKYKSGYVGVFNHRNYLSKLIYLLHPNVWFFDDGMATIENYIDSKMKMRKRCFVSIFPLEGDELINIDYLEYGGDSKIEVNEDAIYIVTSALSYNGILNEDDYLTITRNIVKKYTELGKNILLFPHRYETDSFVNEIEASVKVYKGDLDFESFIELSMKKPKVIIGFNSTLLFLMSRDNDIIVKSIDICNIIHDEQHKFEFIKTFDFFRSVDGIEVVDVNDFIV